MSEEVDYSEMLRIDLNALDKEWLEQAGKFMTISAESARVNGELDKAKDELEVFKAEVDFRIRSNPTKYGLESPTEKAISAAIDRNKKYQRKRMKLIAMKERVALLSGAVKSFEQRKKALENLVTLSCQGYFAEPRVPQHNITDERRGEFREKLSEKKETSVTEKIQERRKKKSRRTKGRKSEQ